MMEEVTIGKARMLHCDCMEFMATLPDGYYDLACCDPPYGIGESGGELHSNRALSGAGKLKNRALNTLCTKWDNAPTKEYFEELMRVSKNQIIWGGNYFDLPPTRGIICWDKVQPWPNFSAWEMAWTSFNHVARMFKFDNRTGDKIHPTQKPQALYEFCLTNYAKQGDKILDSHGGSMSSVIAALNFGFEITCCELDADYFKSGVERVRQSQQQARMFEPETVVPKQDTLI